MAKKIVGYIKLQIPAGKANPSPPVGPALGQKGLNIMEFCKAFNAKTQSMEAGLPVPVVITAFADKRRWRKWSFLYLFEKKLIYLFTAVPKYNSLNYDNLAVIIPKKWR